MLRAAERSQAEEEARQSGGLLRDRAQRVLVERLERQRPGCDLRCVHEAVGVEHVPDVAEEPGDEARAEDHEDRDPVRDRAEKDRAEQRHRRHEQHAPGQLETWDDDAVRPPRSLQSREHHRGEVDRQDIRYADRGRAEEARDEERRAADRTDDERL